MAKNFLVPIDMNELEIQNFIVHVLASAPTSVSGKLYFNSTNNIMYYYNGTAWIPLVGVNPSSTTPLMDGTAAVGSETAYARGDHRHPSDTTKVDKVAGKGLSTNDFTTALLNKLNGIASGAEVNVQSDWNQADSSADDYIKNKPTIDTAMSSSSTNAVQNNVIYQFVMDQVAAADAMRFKGTIGTTGDIQTLPTTGVKIGDTYRVVTAGTYAGEVCEIGDLIIATSTTPTWTVAQTNIDGAITQITQGTGITVTGSGNSRTISLESGVGANVSKGDTTNQTPAFGGTFKALSETVDTYGRTTVLNEHTVTIPDTKASTSVFGLMKVGTGLNVNNGVVSSNTGFHIDILTAGTTSVSTNYNAMAYTAFDHTTGEEVVVDSAITDPSGVTPGMTFSIAASYTNDIYIYGVEYV